MHRVEEKAERLDRVRSVLEDVRLVPVEDRPFQSAVPALHCNPRDIGQQAAADPVSAARRSDVEILQVESWPAQEGGEGLEVDGVADGLDARVRDDDFRGGPGSEQGSPQGVFCGDDLVQQLLVFRELPDESKDDRDVFLRGRLEADGV